MYVNITKAVTNNPNLAKFPRTGAAANDIHYLGGTYNHESRVQDAMFLAALKCIY